MKLIFKIEDLRIVSDIQGSGEKGASFSNEWIDFDTINAILKAIGNKLKRKSADLHPCFEKPSSNNGSMLAVILVNLNVIDNNYNVISSL